MGYIRPDQGREKGESKCRESKGSLRGREEKVAALGDG
jgi:hypothetical protein